MSRDVTLYEGKEKMEKTDTKTDTKVDVYVINEPENYGFSSDQLLLEVCVYDGGLVAETWFSGTWDNAIGRLTPHFPVQITVEQI